MAVYLTPTKIARLRRKTMPSILSELAAAIALGIPNKGTKAVGVLRVASAVKDAQTVTIGRDVYEVDTRDASHVTSGNIRLDLSAGSTVKMQATLTVDTQPIAGDTMTIGTKVYTFVPTGQANVDGQIALGGNVAATQPKIVAAINGSDSINTAHPLVTAGAFAVNASVVTSISGGIATIACTETFTAGTNIFDATTLGTTTAGVDPTAAEFTTALTAAINASGVEAVTAVRVSNNEVLVHSDAVGVVILALSETLAGTNNAWDTSAMRVGLAEDVSNVALISRVPNAQEVAIGNLHVPLSFTPSVVIIQVRVTSGGSVKAWNGAYTIGTNLLTLDNSSSTDWATTDTISILAIG